jgi:hypothetical protein
MPLGRLAAIATLAFLVVVITATSALASTFVRRDPGNVLLASGTTLISSTGFFTAHSLGSGMSCAPSLDAALEASGGATVTATLNSFTLAPCSGSIASVGFNSCHAIPPLPSLTITQTGSGAVTTWPGTSMRCNVVGAPASACYYRAQHMTGMFANATSTWVHANFTWLHTVPAGTTNDLGALCNTSSTTYTMDFRDVHTTGGTTVTVTAS